jgi:hypothetical protein
MIHITAQMRVLVAIESVDGRKGVPLRSLSERIWYGKACRLPLLGRSRDASIQGK